MINLKRVVFVIVTIFLSNYLIAQTIFSIADEPDLKNFSFCGTTYKAPTSSQLSTGNTIDSIRRPYTYVGRLNEFSLYWEYFQSEDLAKLRFEELLNMYRKNMQRFAKTPIEQKLFLCGSEVNGYKIEYKVIGARRWHKILTYGLVNNQWVVVKYCTHKKLLKNSQINRRCSAILSLKE